MHYSGIIKKNKLKKKYYKQKNHINNKYFEKKNCTITSHISSVLTFTSDVKFNEVK